MPARQVRRMDFCRQNAPDHHYDAGLEEGSDSPRAMQETGLPAPHPGAGLRRIERTLGRIFLLLFLGWAGGIANSAHAAEGLALAIVYDTSGSMRDSVPTADGKKAAKYLIANRALEHIIQRIDHFTTNAAVLRPVQAGLFVFHGQGVREAVPFGPFQSARMLDWVKNYKGPDSGTPLGLAIEAASRPLLASKLDQKHILVITDGQNTIGPDPVGIVPRIQKSAANRGSSVFVHFVAFDVDAKVFNDLKKLGVTVVGAADEKQLNQQLEFILEEKILLEREEPKKP